MLWGSCLEGAGLLVLLPPRSPIRSAARSLSSSSLASEVCTLSDPLDGDPRMAANSRSTESMPERGVPGGRGDGAGVVLEVVDFNVETNLDDDAVVVGHFLVDGEGVVGCGVEHGVVE